MSDSTYTEDLLFEAGELPHPIVQLEEHFMQKGSAPTEDYLECDFGHNDDGILGKDSTDHIQQLKELYLNRLSMKQKHPTRHCGPDKNHKSEIETLGSLREEDRMIHQLSIINIVRKAVTFQRVCDDNTIITMTPFQLQTP